MISGTSKSSLNLDPINGQIWTRGPHIYGFYYAQILQKTLESIWEHPGKYYLWKSETQQIRKNRVVCVPDFLNLLILTFAKIICFQDVPIYFLIFVD